MAKLLYITCNLKPIEQSRSLSVGKEFLDEYLRRNPADEVHFLDLYRDSIQRIDLDVLNGWGKMRKGEKFSSLASVEQRKIEYIVKHAEQFAAADKYVFVTPMWNLGFPPELKIYIDSVCIAGKTFDYSPDGPIGLLKDKNKKCLHIHSSGGLHYGKPEDHSVPYLKAIMYFMGVDDFEAIVIEGVDAFPDRALDLIKAATEKAISVAAQF